MVEPAPIASYQDGDIIPSLTPTQEHFLKKYILENRLSEELHQLNMPDCCQYIGPPFKSDKIHMDANKFPLLSFFFENFLTTFPFITNNSEEDQIEFWQNTVQPFVESFNSKHISSSEERQENITKRRQVNKKFLSGLLLFYNSFIITDKDLIYLHEDHLKPSDVGNLDKLQITNEKEADQFHNVELDEYNRMAYYNDLSVNLIAVRTIKANGSNGSKQTASVVSTNSAKNSWNPIRKFLGTNDTKPKHNYEFIIQVVTRHDATPGSKGKKEYTYKAHFIARPYHEFKALEQSLRKEFPGLMSTEGFSIPHKAKHDNGIADNNGSNSGTPKQSMDSENSVASEQNKGGQTKLVREKLRLSLRGYLTSLIKFPEIANSDNTKTFLFEESRRFYFLTSLDMEDYETRMKHERSIYQTQMEFQQRTAKVIKELTRDFDQFKQNLVMEPGTITELFEEIGKTPDVNNLSPLLKTFNEWCKLEVAATLYQIFLGSDNSNEWLNKCKKFHFVFPYTVVYGILRFTNPVKITSRIVDLLLVNFPKFSMPSWRSEPTPAEQQKPAGARNLLSMIFIMLLDEDLNGFEKEIKGLKEEKIDPKYNFFLERLEAYSELSYEFVAEVKAEASENDEDLLLTTLSTNSLEPHLKPLDKNSQAWKDIVESYQAYESLGENKDLTKSQLYLDLKQYWQLLIRKNDKNIFKQLWQESELTKLIKTFLTIFYQPLMKLFAKSDMHLVFKSFQKFMDDLMVELTQLSKQEMYFLSSIEIFDRLKSLLDNHQASIWEFIHNVYVNDDQQIFLKLIRWIEKFLILLRLKFVDEESVKLKMSTKGLNVDHELFIKQLNARADKVIGRRKLFKEYMAKKTLEASESSQGRLDKQWDQVNDEMFNDVDVSEFGVGAADVEDFNYVHVEDEFDDVNTGGLEKELRTKIHLLEKSDNYGTSELDKLDHAILPQIMKLLKEIDI